MHPSAARGASLTTVEGRHRPAPRRPARTLDSFSGSMSMQHGGTPDDPYLD
ncbi:hypothetical protein [Lysobacter gummosus]|uniref:hypothetical protein n=1 Tax=Lysobacter gummosus TaxID=262324 RepID=UPI0036258564